MVLVYKDGETVAHAASLTFIRAMGESVAERGRKLQRLDDAPVHRPRRLEMNTADVPPDNHRHGGIHAPSCML